MSESSTYWPTFLGIGVPKAGSTWLHEILNGHPQIWVPEESELHFFDRYYQERGLSWYGQLFPSRENNKYRAVGEVTPQYIYCEPEQIDTLKSAVPSIDRFILILRNPVDALYSGYWFARRVDNIELSFREFIEKRPHVLEYQHYARYVERWLERFDRDQFLVLTMEKDLHAVEEARAKIAKFLDVNPGLFPAGAGREKRNSRHLPYFRSAYAWAVHLNAKLKRADIYWPARVAESLGVKRWFGKQEVNREMDSKIQEELAAIYADDVARLEQLLGREFPEWDLAVPESS